VVGAELGIAETGGGGGGRSGCCRGEEVVGKSGGFWKGWIVSVFVRGLGEVVTTAAVGNGKKEMFEVVGWIGLCGIWVWWCL